MPCCRRTWARCRQHATLCVHPGSAVKQITIQNTTWPERVRKGENWRSGKYTGSNALEIQQHISDTPRRVPRTKINCARPTPVHTYRRLASRKNSPEIGGGRWMRREYNWICDFFNKAPFSATLFDRSVAHVYAQPKSWPALRVGVRLRETTNYNFTSFFK